MFKEAKTEGDLDRCIKVGITALSKPLELMELLLAWLREVGCNKTASIIEGRYVELRKRYDHLRGLSDLHEKAGGYTSLCNDLNGIGDVLLLIVTAIGEYREDLQRRLEGSYEE